MNKQSQLGSHSGSATYTDWTNVRNRPAVGGSEVNQITYPRF